MSHLVLVVDDETILAESISVYLQRHGYATMVAFSGEDGIRSAEEACPDVVLMDIRLPGIDGLKCLRKIRDVSPHIEVIMMTGEASVASVVEAMKRGAFDYLSKPLDLEEVKVVVDKAVSHQRMRQELSYLKARDETGKHVSEIIGESRQIQALLAQIERIASLESPEGGEAPTVLIVGETGTGKELVARAIHYQSPRSAGPFVEINCAAIPSALLEAELFGYEKGAYTDAKTAKPGLFEAAGGGTIFLDEIGYMEPAMQVKLLKVIEDKSVRRMGSLRSKTINTRIISASNRDLKEAIAEGGFRADLYYRLNVLTVDVPLLRERGADIVLLAHYFLDRFAKQYGRPPKQLTPEAESLLQSYTWPGNVRELAHVVERAALLPTGSTLAAEHLNLSTGKPKAPVVVGSNGSVSADFSEGGIVLDDVERELIVKALDASGWNRSQASELLGISMDTLRYRMEKHQLHRPDRASPRPTE